MLWLKGNSIVVALEVECTTSVDSGLLRMSDLLFLQPNLDIKLYLVASEERRDKVEQEIQRPTFSLREKVLPKVCGFLPFNKLCETVEGIRKLQLAASLQPNFSRRWRNTSLSNRTPDAPPCMAAPARAILFLPAGSGLREPPGARRDRRGDRGGPAGRPGAVRGGGGRPEGASVRREHLAVMSPLRADL
ncbi:hypothetical protein [Sorangium sp. So ce887]|uniref:hypothetical protein n=1 Tax=Sorangium sp. So ce887 TaxID=3133324 RepID=UPI003F614073